MKIQCQSCQAKYTIADEKVLGKVVKIRCKKCSATIVINGNDQPHAEEAAETHVFDYAQQGNEQWTVNVADGDQRTMTAQEIISEYRNGVVNDETYCWKDGMADWLPLREVEQLYGAVKFNTRQSHEDISVQPQSVPPPAAPLFSSSEVSGAVDSPFAGAAAYAGNGHGNGNGAGALFAGGGLDAHAAPAAARRGGGRGQGADLFGNVEKAGGEDDVMTSAAGGGGAGAAGAAVEDPKLTGQRNENSVLFSLSALTDDKKAPKENRTTASADGSGLIDIRALSANMDAGENRKDSGARVDDIMNLSGGGAFGAALAAPILAPPPLEASDPGHFGGAPQKSNKTLIFAILGGCAFIALAIVVAVVLTMGSGSSSATTATPSATVSAPAPDGTGTGAVAQADPGSSGGAAAATTGETPAPPGTGNNAAAKPGTVNAPPGKPGVHHPGMAAGGGETKPAAAPAPAPEAPKDFNSALAQAAGKPKETGPAAPAAGNSSPFDRGAAAASLGSVNPQSCKRPDGPTGSGHVMVTFGPDGAVQSAVVDSGPFPGTPVGGCIAGKYRGAHVPAFSGAPVRVGKSFTIN